MADAVELATAYVSLVPSMQGAQGLIAKQLIPGAEAAGDEAGKKGGGRFNSSFMKFAAPAAVAGGLVAGFKGLYEVGSIFDDVADTIRVGTGATGDALDGLVASAEAVGKSVPAEFEAVGTTVADVNTRLGLSGDTLETVASQYLEAGRILGEEVDISKTSAAFSAFKIEGDDVVGAMDSLFQISQATGVGMNELADSVKANAPALQNLGFTFEETAAFAGSLDKAGLNSTATMSAMSKGLVTLAKDGEEPQAAFERITGEIGSLVEAGDTAAAIDLASGIFGTRGANQFVGAVESGTLALDDLVGAAGATDDTILGVGAETQDFAEKWQLVKNNALAALEPIGSTVFTALGDALGALLPHLESFGVWLGDNTWVLGALAAVIGVTLVGAFFAWTASVWASTAALLANPITWIVLGIGALIAVLILLVANWDSVVAWLSDVWAATVEWLSGTWDAIWEKISGVGTSIATFLTDLWTSITTSIAERWNAIRDWFSELWGKIKTGFVNGWNAIISWVTGVPDRVFSALAAIGRLAAKIGGYVASAKDAAVEKFLDLVGWVKGVPRRVLDALGDVGKLLGNAGKQIIEGFLNGLKEKFEAVKDFVTGIGSWIADHKGPKAYDLGLLVPAGGWIMDGLQSGLRASIPDLERTLDDVTNTIRVGVPDNVDVRASGAGLLNTGFPAPAAAAGSGLQIGTLNTGADPAEIFDELAWRERVAAL